MEGDSDDGDAAFNKIKENLAKFNNG